MKTNTRQPTSRYVRGGAGKAPPIRRTKQSSVGGSRGKRVTLNDKQKLGTRKPIAKERRDVNTKKATERVLNYAKDVAGRAKDYAKAVPGRVSDDVKTLFLYQFDCSNCFGAWQAFSLLLGMGLLYLCLMKFALARATLNATTLSSQSSNIAGNTKIGFGHRDVYNKVRIGLSSMFFRSGKAEPEIIGIFRMFANALNWKITSIFNEGLTEGLTEEQTWETMSEHMNRIGESAQADVILDSTMNMFVESMQARGDALMTIINPLNIGHQLRRVAVTGIKSKAMEYLQSFGVLNVIQILSGNAYGQLRVVSDAFLTTGRLAYGYMWKGESIRVNLKKEIYKLFITVATGAPAVFHFSMLIIHDRIFAQLFSSARPCCKQLEQFVDADITSAAQVAGMGALGAAIAATSGQSYGTIARSAGAAMTYGAARTVLPNVVGLVSDVGAASMAVAQIDPQKIPKAYNDEVTRATQEQQRIKNLRQNAQTDSSDSSWWPW